MSNRPVARIVVKNSKTGKYTDIAAIWPNRFDEEDGTLSCKRGITFGSTGNNNPDYNVSIDTVCELIRAAASKGGGVFIDLAPPFKPRDAEGSDTPAEFS